MKRRDFMTKIIPATVAVTALPVTLCQADSPQKDGRKFIDASFRLERNIADDNPWGRDVHLYHHTQSYICAGLNLIKKSGVGWKKITILLSAIRATQSHYEQDIYICPSGMLATPDEQTPCEMWCVANISLTQSHDTIAEKALSVLGGYGKFPFQFHSHAIKTG